MKIPLNLFTSFSERFHFDPILIVLFISDAENDFIEHISDGVRKRNVQIVTRRCQICVKTKTIYYDRINFLGIYLLICGKSDLGVHSTYYIIVWFCSGN